MIDSFDLFWAIYPRHEAKKDARKVWEKIAPSPELRDAILRAIEAQSYERAKKIARREWVPAWPYPASWLRGERWTDECNPPPATIDLARARATLKPDEYRRLLEHIQVRK